NYIGTDVTGTLALANSGPGIEISTGAHDNTIGGMAAGAGNVISGNSGDGVKITDVTTSGNVVVGNRIGLNAPGAGTGIPGTVGWWKGEGNALDSQDGNDGTLLGNPTFGAGKVGQAFVFDGANSAVRVPNNPAFESQTVTLETWVKSSSPPGLAYILSKGRDGNIAASYALYSSGGSVFFYIYSTDSGAV